MTFPSLIRAISETHESPDKSEEEGGEVCGEAETQQGRRAVTVNVNKIHGVSTEHFISLFTSLCSCSGSARAEVTDPAEATLTGCFRISRLKEFMGHENKS